MIEKQARVYSAVWRRRARLLARLAFLPWLVLTGIGIAAEAFDATSSPAIGSALLIAFVVAMTSSVALPIISLLMRTGGIGALQVRADADGIALLRHAVAFVRIPWSRLGASWRPRAETIELTTTDGDELHVGLARPEDAHELLGAFRAQGDHRKAYAIPLESDATKVARASIGWAAMGLLCMLAPLLAPPIAAGGAIAASFVAAWLLAREDRRIEFGADGIVLHRLRGRRYIPYRTMQSVRVTTRGAGQRVAITLTDGGRVVVGSYVSPARALLLERLLHEGMQMAESGEAAGAELAVLRRVGDEDARSWWQRVKSAVQQRGYRGIAIEAERLLALMRNPAAPSEQRVAAALALRDRPNGTAQIRVAAEVSTEPEVREVFEALAEERLDDQRVEQLVARLR